MDIDTYGRPWGHWEALLPNINCPATVFLTIGQVQMMVDKRTISALGLGNLRIPPAIQCKIEEIALSYLLAKSCVYGKIVVEAVEAVSGGSARYLGIHLKKRPK